MMRREFLATTVSAPLAAGMTSAEATPGRSGSFKLKYAPHFGMFRHHGGDDVVGQLEFMAAEGFTALEDNGMQGRALDEQRLIARTMNRLDMTMGVFVAHADFGAVTFAERSNDMHSRLTGEIDKAIDTAQRVNAKWCTVVPGRYEPRVDWDYQTANVIENLKHCAERCERTGLVMVLEPLNPRDHPGLFLTKVAQAFMICEAVASPSCKILDDLYHQQVTEGNLIPNIDRAYSEIGYFQVGDNPGRREPTTGEINYRNVFRHIHGKGFGGIVGMEHGNAHGGRDGERAVIDAYRTSDDF